MAMRLSGLMSGMDTESIVQQLVEAKGVKVKTAKKAQIKLGWKQDAWKDLNKKIKNLQSQFVSNMRFGTAYSKKATKVSNAAAVSVITGENAVNGVQSLEINQLAKTGYLTGAELKRLGNDGKQGTEKGNYTAMTKMSELGFTGEGTFSIKAGEKSVDVSINKDMTISDVLTKIKGVGLNASFDSKTQRFFVSALKSGTDNDFSFTASDQAGADALKSLGLQVNLNEDTASLKQYQEYEKYFVSGANSRQDTLDNMKTMVDETVQSRTGSYLAQYKSLAASKEQLEKSMEDVGITLTDGKPDISSEEYADKIKVIEENLKNNTYVEGEEKENAEKELAKLIEQKSLVDSYDNVVKKMDDIAGVDGWIQVTENKADDGTVSYEATASNKLKDQVGDEYYAKAAYAAQVISSYNPDDKTGTGATKVSGQDAEITLNGATFTNNTNVFEINGLTFTALSETNPGESVTVTTQNDTDGIYDMVKKFFKEYNAVINEIDKLYNADAAKDMDPLLTEEKESMSEDEVKEYEKKIKDAIFRRDSDLSSISSSLRGIMSAGVEVNGKTMYLQNFGIDFLGYFNAAENEKNAYHIDGDPDDEDTSGKADVLKGMISSDPDTVIAFFSKLSQNLYDKMTEMSRSVDGYRSFGSFYDDKKMKTDYDDYKTKISELEKKLNAYEDSWYSKFAKMETAMAKMQKNTSALTGLLGGQ